MAVQNYSVQNITSFTLINPNNHPSQLRVLAGAYTKGKYSFSVHDQPYTFEGLESAGPEVDNIAKVFPDTTKLLNEYFNSKDTLDNLSIKNYNILHMATHAVLVVGQPEDSFIMFGNGKIVTLPETKNWRLNNVDLVVLSACKTGLNGNFGNGVEILGFGYEMQNAGVIATIASLWNVNDGGTQNLMNAFYAALKTGNTKAQALQPTFRRLVKKEDNIFDKEHQKTGESIAFPGLSW